MSTPLAKVKPIIRPSLGKGETIHFPEDLSDERYVIIKIYDTAQHDPNKLLAKGGGLPIEGLKEAFTLTKTTSTSDSSLTLSNIIDKVKDIGKSALQTVVDVSGGLGKEALNTALAHSEGALENFKTVGNPALKEEWKDNIFLPLPNELNENLSHTYGEETGLAKGLDKATGGAMQASVATLITGPSNHISKATGTQKLIFNENKLAQFTESQFRSITLTWTMIPNNEKESKSIHSIITKIKAYSSPQAVAGKLLLRAPFFCRLEFPNKVLHEALQFHEAVITGIEVNYSVTGYMETFEDNTPKTMSLSVTFQDREPKTLQAWAQGESGYEIDFDKYAATAISTNADLDHSEGNVAYENGATYGF